MKRILIVCCTVLLFYGTAGAWWAGGHGVLTRAAVRAVPEEVPAFFRSGELLASHCVFDPDVAKNRGTPLVRGAEHPEHYLDLEWMKGAQLPQIRYEFVALCDSIGVRPETVGFLPYAAAEWTERLAVAFAEHRKWPDNIQVQQKCLVYAGFLAHYAQDLCQPLHTTIHFNGRANADGSSSHSGIHEKVDGLIEFLKLTPEELANGQQVAPLADLMPDVLEAFAKSFSLVDRVYELEANLPTAGDENWKRDSDVIDFAQDRTREAVRFTAALYLTAWKRSAEIRVPGWLDRAKLDQ